MAQMRKEEELSRLPPLSQAPAPLLNLATHNGMNIRWPPLLRNVNRKQLQPGDVTYVLQMHGGFLSFHEEPNVEVFYVLQPWVATSSEELRVGKECVITCSHRCSPSLLTQK